MDRTFWPSIALLLAVFVFFEITEADLWIQDRLYDFSRHAWLVNADSALPRLIFYTGPKALIWTFGIGLLVISSIPEKYSGHLFRAHLNRKDAWVVIGTLAIAPLSIAMLKATTNVHTPSELCHYGGFAPYVKVCQPTPKSNHPMKRGRGFPAGHASGGFSLMALAGLAATKRGRALGITIGLLMGSSMGLYQMFKGAHYMSHTLVTAILCWIVFLLLRRIRHGFHLTER